MNKNRFRVLFNKIRGLLMVVSEKATGRANKSASIGKAATSSCIANIRPVVFALMVIFGHVFLIAPASAGGIVADSSAPSGQQPTIISTASGLPQVNIQTPSAAGVSRNTYSQFDVSQAGAILNNSRTNVQTQLGGFIQGNPNLAGGTARIILNEVNSNNPSLLNGYIEVAGSRAQVVIANPAGISCDGCGFINANRATLTTGTPVMNSGNLLGYRVGGGTISFMGAGLDASQANFTDVIARAVQVNAGIFGNTLNVTTGTNQVNVDANGNQTGVTPIAADAGSNAPAFAIDVAALGGMYAGKIHMIGTEAGLGVRNASTIGASVGEVSITVDGLLQNTGVINAKTNIQLDTVALESAGSIVADGNIDISLASDYIHTGELQAGGNLGLQTTGNITNQSTLLASQSLTISADNINNTATGEMAGLTTHVTAADTITNRGLIDGIDTIINAATLANTETGSIFGDHLAIRVAHLGNDAGAVIAARNRLDIGADSIENFSNGLIFSAGDLAVGGSLDSNNEATGSADTLVNDGSTIEALGNAAFAATDLQNLNTNLVTHVVMTGTSGFDRFTARNQSDILDSGDFPVFQIGNVNAEWRYGSTYGLPYNFREYTRYLGTKRFYETQVVSSMPGQILSGGDMLITGSVTNSDSRIIAGGNLDVSGATVQNLNSEGQTITSYSGTAYYYDWDGNDNDYDVDVIGPYNPANTTLTYNLTTSRLDGNTAPVGSGATVTSAAVPIVTGSLFQTNPDASSSYLIETNPRFASYRTWLSSDYMMQQLSFDPAMTQKRLGDGFYEQRLVREQVAQLTGQRFLTGYASDEAQFQALMTSAVTQANLVQLIPGVALTRAQIAQLTSDIVWLIEQTVTLPDGTVTKVLVPQVYVRLQAGDLHPTTGIMAGNSVTIALSGDVTNQGTIAGREFLALTADNIHNLGGQIVADTTLLTAVNDINNIGGQVIAKDAMLLDAGNDINLRSTTQSSQNRDGASSFSRTNLDRVAGLYMNNPDSILVANAGNDVNLMAASIVNQGANGTTEINAGQNINLGAVTIAEQNSSIRNAKNYVKHGGTQEIGSVIETTGNIAFNTGNDFNAKAVSVTSEAGAIKVTAVKDINITEGRETSNFDTARKVKKSGTFSSKTKTQHDVFEGDNSISSNFSGDTVTLQAGDNINIRGSNVVSDNGTTLVAGDNVNITAAKNTLYELHERKTKKSGLSSSGMSVSIGTQQLNTKQTSNSTSHTSSTVGSVEGDVNIIAGENYKQTASDVIAPQGDIDISAQSVNIVAAQNTNVSVQETKFKQSGLTLSIQSSTLNLAQDVVGTAQASLQSEGTRNKALNALQTYANGATLAEQGGATIDAIKAGNVQDAAASAGVKLSVSVGSAKSESSRSSSITTQQGSLVKARGDVSIKATQDDLTLAGSQIVADKNITLDAARNLNLIASTDTESNRSKNKSSSASIGLSVGVSSQGAGLSVGIDASHGKGGANSDSVTYNNTQVSAGETLILNTGNDANLIGANASGKQVIVDVEGDLNIQSLQDTANSKAKQSNTGISISVPIGVGTVGGSISQNKQKSNSNYASVYQQSGIKSGEEGFDINVTGNTALKGAVIDSTADTDKNRLTTGTLTVSDVQNHMDAEASSSGTTLGSEMLTSKYAAAKGIASNLQSHGEADMSDSSTTLSAISPADITIADESAQQELTGKNAEETIAALNRDTTNTNRELAKPDLEVLQKQAQQQQAEKILLLNTVTAFTDESFRKMFVSEAKMYHKVTDSDGKVQWVELTEDQKLNLQAGQDNKIHIFNNGIFNPLENAQQLAEQNNNADYLVYFPEANNFLSELMIAGYTKFLEGTTLGLTNATQTNVQIMNQYGSRNLQVDGHSRGGMTIGNALETIAQQGNAEGILVGTNISLFGSAYNAEQATELLNKLSNGTGSVQSQVHIDDFVGTILGRNQPTGGTTPINSNLLKEWVKIVYGNSTPHNNYGDGKPDDSGQAYWQDSPDGKAITKTITPTK